LQHPPSTRAKEVRHRLGHLDVGLLHHRAEAIVHLGAGLHQGDARAAEIT
jgi:hypothetical protein